MNVFEKPQHPTGYVVFDHETKCFRGKYLHLSDVRKFCVEHNIHPTEIIVLRTFGPQDFDYNRKLVGIEEYAFKHTFREKVGQFYVEREDWKWEAQPEIPETNIPLSIFNNLKSKLYLFCIKVREIFPYSI